MCDETQSVRETAETLKSILYAECPFRYDQNEMMSASRATVRVPAAGPKRRTEVNTNVSETETTAGSAGRLTVAEPLTSVSNARIAQGFGMLWLYSCTNEWTIVADPATVTAAMYARVDLGSLRNLRGVILACD